MRNLYFKLALEDKKKKSLQCVKEKFLVCFSNLEIYIYKRSNSGAMNF